MSGPGAARRFARGGLLVVAEVGAVVILHRLGSAPGFGLPGAGVGRWLRDTPPLDATAAILRLVALGGAWWLLASTVWWLVLAVRGVARPRSVAAMPGTRRLVEAVLAVTLAAGTTLTGPAASAAPTGPTTAIATSTTTTTAPLVLGRDPNGVRSGRRPGVGAHRPDAGTVTGTGTGTGSGITATGAGTRPRRRAGREPLGHRRGPGRGRDRARAAAAVPPDEVAPYWRRLCDANRATVRSGDLDLIYPGEVLELPEL